MPTITFLHSDRSVVTVAAEPGRSVMSAAKRNGVAGMQAECGGNLMCATCHVYVDETAETFLPPISSTEEAMLDCTAEPRTARSRLSCQLIVREDWPDFKVEVPGRQL